jgi:hypothetical protein
MPGDAYQRVVCDKRFMPFRHGDLDRSKGNRVGRFAEPVVADVHMTKVAFHREAGITDAHEIVVLIDRLLTDMYSVWLIGIVTRLPYLPTPRMWHLRMA